MAPAFYSFKYQLWLKPQSSGRYYYYTYTGGVVGKTIKDRYIKKKSKTNSVVQKLIIIDLKFIEP